MCLFLAALALCRYTWTFSLVVSGGFSLRGVVLLQSPGSRACKLQEFGLPGSTSQAQELWLTGLSYSLACGILLDQGLNPCLLRCKADSLPLSHQGSRLLLHTSSSVTHSCLTLVTPWTAARQASLSITISRRLLKLMSIQSVMASKHLIFCRSLLLPPSIFPSIRVFSSEAALRIRWP